MKRGEHSSKDFHGLHLTGMNGQLLSVFAPPWWRFDLWLWWFWKCYLERYVQRVMRALHRPESYQQFVHGIVTLRFGTASLDVRVWQVRTRWLVWSPPAIRIAVDNSSPDKSPDYQLPPTTNVHPNERGI